MKRYPRVLEIARMGHPTLHEEAAIVEDSTCPEIAQIIEDMIETMEHLHSTGLGAPQVLIPLQLLIYRVRPHGAPLDFTIEEVPWTVMMNPKVTILTDKTTSRWESCLSLPDLTGYVPRFDHIHCSYIDAQGVPQEKEVRGYHARVIQHESDHLKGVLYPQRLTDFSKFGFRNEVGDNLEYHAKSKH